MAGAPKKTRETTARTKTYRPPNALDAPEPNSDDVKYRWVRVSLQNEDDAKNISKRRAEEWEPVKAEEHPDFIGPTHEEGRFAGAIGVGDLVLMKNSRENIDGRNDYYKQKTVRQTHAVQFDKMQDVQDPRAKTFNDSKSTSSNRGTKQVVFDD